MTLLSSGYLSLIKFSITSFDSSFVSMTILKKILSLRDSQYFISYYVPKEELECWNPNKRSRVLSFCVEMLETTNELNIFLVFIRKVVLK